MNLPPVELAASMCPITPFLVLLVGQHHSQPKSGAGMALLKAAQAVTFLDSRNRLDLHTYTSNFFDEYDDCTGTGVGIPTSPIVVALKRAIGAARGLQFTCDSTPKHDEFDWAPWARAEYSEYTERCEGSGSTEHPEPAYTKDDLERLTNELAPIIEAWLAENGNKPHHEADHLRVRRAESPSEYLT